MEEYLDPALSALLIPRPAELLHCFDTLDSTNTYLKRQAERMADGTVVLADSQSGGRGRQGRSFHSASGKGIYLSVLWRCPAEAASLLSLTALGAVAVANAVEQVCHTRPGIKWINDLLLNNKKICGILTELSLQPDGQIRHIIMGIGLNVSQTPEDFPPEVAAMASSLAQELGHPVSRTELSAALIRELDRLRQMLDGDYSAYLAAYRRDCVTLGKEVQLLWRDSTEQVFALDVDEQFGLVVRHQDGHRETIRSGEVSVRGLYGYVPN